MAEVCGEALLHGEPKKLDVGVAATGDSARSCKKASPGLHFPHPKKLREVLPQRQHRLQAPQASSRRLCRPASGAQALHLTAARTFAASALQASQFLPNVPAVNSVPPHRPQGPCGASLPAVGLGVSGLPE